MIYGEASTTVTAPPAQVLDLVCDLGLPAPAAGQQIVRSGDERLDIVTRAES